MYVYRLANTFCGEEEGNSNPKAEPLIAVAVAILVCISLSTLSKLPVSKLPLGSGLRLRSLSSVSMQV